MNLYKRLSERLSKNDICEITRNIQTDSMKEKLYLLTLDGDNRVALQALWVFRHFDESNNEWLYCKHNDLIDRVIAENNVAKQRLILSLLLRQPMKEENLRSDFLDFCIANITACSMPYAVRAQCIKLAYEQCKFFPELLGELKAVLDMLAQEPLSPGLASAKQQVMKKLKRKTKK